MASLPKKRQSNENRKEKKGLKLKKYLKISVAFHCGSREEIILKYFDLNCIPFKMCVCVNSKQFTKSSFHNRLVPSHEQVRFFKKYHKNYVNMCACVCLKMLCIRFLGNV